MADGSEQKENAMIDWDRYPHFQRHEFECRCGCGKADMDPAFMYALQEARNALGSAMTVSSGFRCPEYNARIGGGPEHVLGKAADILVSGEAARAFLTIAAMHFPRIGVFQKGPHNKRFIHVGTALAEEVKGASPGLWSY